MLRAYKYRKLHESLKGCPPTDYREVSIIAFRFVHHPNDSNNFLPVQLLSPSRKFEDDDAHCKALGLSFFADKIKAKSFYQKRIAKSPRFAKIVGENIATLLICPEDGVAAVPEETNSGHFTFHEYLECDFQKRIENVESIIIG